MIEQYKNKSRILRFFLSNPSEGKIELYHAPDGWKDSGYSFSRSGFYGGVFRKYAIDKLGFPKEAKKFIKRVEDSQGFEADLFLDIWEHDCSIYSTFVLFSGQLKLVKKSENRLKINIPLIDSSFEDKLLNREDVNIIVTKRSESEVYTSLDGGAILGFSNEKRLLTLPERIDFLSSLMSSDRDLTYLTNEDKDPIIPLLLKGDSNDENVKGNSNNFKQVAGAFYVNSTNADAEIEIGGSFGFIIKINTPVFNISDIEFNLFVIDNTDAIIKTINIQVNKVLIFADFTSAYYSCSGNINVNDAVPENGYIQIGIMREGTIGDMFTTGTVIDFSLSTQADVSEQANIETTFVHEAFARIGQKITGQNNPFISNLFGRKNSEPRSYVYDGEDSLLAITNGALIRGFPMTNKATSVETIAPLSISLKDLFQACSVKRPLGMGIETVDGSKAFRIEELKYFFDTRVALIIENATELEEEYNEDLIQNEFAAGYTKFETDEIQDGFFDYNTKSAWANAITSVKDKLSVISKYSASNASINEARSVALSRANKPTTDSKYDDINFLVDAVENTTGNSVLNPNADNGTSDWSISSGVTTRLLLGNNKFVLDQNNDGQIVMSQNLGVIDTPVISFSFAVLSSNELIFTPTCRIVARLNDTSVKYLNSNGDWVDDLININTQSVNGVVESQLQSMFKFNVAAKTKLDNINFIEISFNTDFLNNALGVNEYIVDDIYVSDSAEYKARTTEGFDSITGIVNPNDSYNILLSPARTLRRWGYVLRASLEDKLNTLFTFADTEKNSNLVSKVTTESFSVSEGQDVLVNDLDTPLWGIEKISFEAALTAAQRKDINTTFEDGKDKILGLVAYRGSKGEAYNYIWIDDLNLGGMDGVAKIEGRPISKYVTVAIPEIAIDDDNVEFVDDDNEEFIIE